MSRPPSSRQLRTPNEPRLLSRVVTFDPATLEPSQGSPQLPQFAAPTTPKQVGGLKHLSYQCEGFSGNQGKLDIKARPLRALVTAPHPIVIPAFQRKFCWTAQQGAQWWADTTRPRDGTLHTIGKLFVKQKDGVLLLIDGQQRVTTTLLQLAALRDASLEFLPGQVGEDLADEIDRYIFLRPDLQQQLVAQLAAQRVEPRTGAATGHLDFALRDDDDVVPGCRLVPSYADRAAFYTLILIGRVRQALTKSTSKVDDARLAPAQHVTDSLQATIKSIFDAALRQRWVEIGARAQQDTAAADASAVFCAYLRQMLASLLNTVSVVYAEILNDVRLAQVFLWLQEKSLFGMGALLYNAAPGITFAACDLVRNLLLAPFMSDTLVAQEEFHLQHWVRPIELRLRTPSAIDDALGRFLAHHPTSYRSELEKQLGSLIGTLARGDTRKPSQGMQLYVSFHSCYEARLVEATERNRRGGIASEASIAEGLSQSVEDLEKQVSLALLQELSAFLANATSSLGAVSE